MKTYVVAGQHWRSGVVLLLRGAALDKGNKVVGGVATMVVVRFEQGVGVVVSDNQQVQEFLWVLNYLYVVCLLVGQHPRAWVGREGIPPWAAARQGGHGASSSFI
jgi:hypothetical protein